MSIYMSSTKISVEKTSAQIQTLLINCGASGIAQIIDPKTRSITGIKFQLAINQAFYSLPIRVEAVKRLLKRQKIRMTDDAAQEQAEKTAWRQVLRWLEAQTALIEVEMVGADEIFLPYRQITTKDGVEMGLYEALQKHGSLRLEVAKT